MRSLPVISPTPEQLPIISRNRPGVDIIRGAAGSGKTSTALLRLSSLTGMFLSRRTREQREDPVRILVLTYNRTLRGYIAELARQQESAAEENVILIIETFAHWAVNLLNYPEIISDDERRVLLRQFGARISLPPDFLSEEVDYILGRFLPEQLESYLTIRRDGRGSVPRVERATREVILSEVIMPYREWLLVHGKLDWNDLAVRLAMRIEGRVKYDVIIADETQDFSANQIRAVLNYAAEPHSVTFIVDTVQRIYARGFTWQEAGIVVRPENVHRLQNNYRNTVEISRLAASLLRGLPMDQDATMPNFATCTRTGPVPVVLVGKFNLQVHFALQYIRNHVNLETESVAFLHAKGWFGYVREALIRAHMPFVEITRQSEWPEDSRNIALSTLHSAKGLEFDHVIIIGLNAEATLHGFEEEDDRLSTFRRLLAMGISRARKSVILGYKHSQASQLIEYLDPATYHEITL